MTDKSNTQARAREVIQWLRETKHTDGFLLSVRAQLLRRGSISDRQYRSVHSAWVTRDDPVPVRAREPDNMDKRALDALGALFERAEETAVALRYILNEDEAETVTVKPVRDSDRSRYTAHMLLDDQWLVGKLAPPATGFSGIGGWFQKVSDRLDAFQRLAGMSALDAAVEYGRATGRCSVCGRTLTDPVSIEAGIGPICAEKL